LKGARALTYLEIQAVCAAFSGKYAVRDRTLFLLCANLGTRITEALNLNVGDVLQNGEVVEALYLRRETQKGKREGVSLTLPSGAREALIAYLSWKRASGLPLRRDTPLFTSRQGSSKRLTRQRAHDIFKAVYAKVGLKGQVTTHSPRKTFAKLVYENSGKDLLVTQRALRHRSIENTLYYLDTLADDVTHAMPNFRFSVDEIGKTSTSKIISLRQLTKRRAKTQDEP